MDPDAGPTRALRRCDARELSVALAADPSNAPLVGLGHEYQVLGPDGQVDFRTVVHGLGLGRSHLDPANPNAYWLNRPGFADCSAY